MKPIARYALLLAAAVSGSVVAQDAPHERQARDVFERSISFRTAAGQQQMPGLIAYLRGVLTAGGVAESDIAAIDANGDPAMIVRIPGSDAGAKPILFSAHMDVVDARPEDWQRDPFKLVEENGYFFGRGTSDNKTGVTSMVSTILRFKADARVPKRTLVFAFVGDEETAMNTTRAIAAHEWVKNAEFAINTDAGGGTLSDVTGKPLIYLVQGAEKTYATFDVVATNPGGHSSRPRVDNAIYQLAHALAKIEAHRFPVMSTELSRGYLGATGAAESGALGEALRAFAKDPADEQAIAVLSANPEYNGTIRTTCVATMLEAGHAENALPQKASAAVNCRIFPGVEVEAVREALVAVVDDPKLTVTVRGKPEASPISEMRDDVMAAITAAVHKDRPGVPIAPYLESGGTDGKVYRIAGIPTYASSGLWMKSSDMFAHGLDERIPVAAFYEAIEHIHRLAVTLGG